MDSLELRNKMRAAGLTVLEGTTDERIRACMEAVKICVRPVTVSDRTCLRNVMLWASGMCETGTYAPEELLPRIIDCALEASKPECRNSRAVFMSLMKKELRYPTGDW